MTLQTLSRTDVSESRFLEVFDETQKAIRDSCIPTLVIGGVASAAYGRPRWSNDLDLFLREEDAGALLREFATRGFETDRTYLDWLFKAFKNGVLVDVIFKCSGEIYLDEEMLGRAQTVTFHDREFLAAAPEDIVVMKAIAHSEPTSRYWYDALGILSRTSLDWEYLLLRGRQGPARILSFLLYARSLDFAVPDDVLDRLFRTVRGNAVTRSPHEGRTVPFARRGSAEER
jgi:predicted nucleotidyltransferase